jgi:hypothetical protein
MPFAPPDVGWGVSLGSPRSSAAASRERAKIDGYACGAAKRSRTERATARAALVPAWSALQRRVMDWRHRLRVETPGRGVRLSAG